MVVLAVLLLAARSVGASTKLDFLISANAHEETKAGIDRKGAETPSTILANLSIDPSFAANVQRPSGLQRRPETSTEGPSSPVHTYDFSSTDPAVILAHLVAVLESLVGADGRWKAVQAHRDAHLGALNSFFSGKTARSSLIKKVYSAIRRSERAMELLLDVHVCTMIDEQAASSQIAPDETSAREIAGTIPMILQRMTLTIQNNEIIQPYTDALPVSRNVAILANALLIQPHPTFSHALKYVTEAGPPSNKRPHAVPHLVSAIDYIMDAIFPLDPQAALPHSVLLRQCAAVVVSNRQALSRETAEAPVEFLLRLIPHHDDYINAIVSKGIKAAADDSNEMASREAQSSRWRARREQRYPLELAKKGQQETDLDRSTKRLLAWLWKNLSYEVAGESDDAPEETSLAAKARLVHLTTLHALTANDLMTPLVDHMLAPVEGIDLIAILSAILVETRLARTASMAMCILAEMVRRDRSRAARLAGDFRARIFQYLSLTVDSSENLIVSPKTPPILEHALHRAAARLYSAIINTMMTVEEVDGEVRTRDLIPALRTIFTSTTEAVTIDFMLPAFVNILVLRGVLLDRAPLTVFTKDFYDKLLSLLERKDIENVHLVRLLIYLYYKREVKLWEISSKPDPLRESVDEIRTLWKSFPPSNRRRIDGREKEEDDDDSGSK